MLARIKSKNSFVISKLKFFKQTRNFVLNIIHASNFAKFSTFGIFSKSSNNW